MILLAILGGIIAFGSMMSGIGIYIDAKSAIHEIYGALLMLNSALGLILMAVSIGAAVITHAVRQAERQAASDRRNLADALRTVAEYKRVA